VSRPAPSLRALLRGAIDYAGLFPPASLSMAKAAAIFATHLASPDAWILGRFIVPVSALGELSLETIRYAGTGIAPWRVSALLSMSDAANAASISSFNAAHAGRLVVDAVEWRGLARSEVADAVGTLPPNVISFVELADSDDLDERLAEIGAARARAKLRTGGVTPDAFPSASNVSRFIARCATNGVPFKATAGLHHPVCGVHALSYADDAPSAKMFGFLNVFVASVFAHLGTTQEQLVDIVTEEDSSAFAFGEDSLCWRDLRASIHQIVASRDRLCNAFGSCSIDEPVHDLRTLQVL
jgi:hypothetical protein